jgi:hypothetical protein
MGKSEILRFGTEAEAIFTVSLTWAATQPVRVDFAAANGSALAGSDYTPASGTITFAPGSVTKTIRVPIVDNQIVEPNESFTVNLSNSTSGEITDSEGIATIVDHDSTKFYVVDDGSFSRTTEYTPNGATVEYYDAPHPNATPRGAASIAAGDKVWVVDSNRMVFMYNSAGGLLGLWTAGGLPAQAQVEGIATNGTDIWIVDGKSDKVYRYTGAASRTSGSQSAASSFSLNSGNKDPKDIVTDGAHLWVVNNASQDKVFKYTLNGSLVGSWTMSGGGGSPTGITLDPASPAHLWIVDSATDRVYQFDNAVTRTSGSQAANAAATFVLAAGNTNPQGIADPPVTKEAVIAADSREAAVPISSRWIDAFLTAGTVDMPGVSELAPGRVLRDHDNDGSVRWRRIAADQELPLPAEADRPAQDEFATAADLVLEGQEEEEDIFGGLQKKVR